MENPITHKILITTGCLLWFVAFLGEAFQGQPYSTIGIIVSPILTIIGILFWLKYYHSTRGHLPKLKKVLDNSANVGGTVTLGFDFLLRYASEFWTICILFWMGFALILELTFGRSDAFEATKNYCQNNQEILFQTGGIEYYGFLVGGNISWTEQGGNAELSFTIVGKNGNFSGNAKLFKQSGTWIVDKMELE